MDRTADQKYVQLIEEWRRDRSVLAAHLPHRTPIDLERVVSRIAIVSWAELLGSIEPRPEEFPVWEEIRRRIR